MNNDLNMQLIEKLVVANESPTNTVESFYKTIDQVFASPVKSYDGLVWYQQKDDTFVESGKTHTSDDVQTLLKADTHDTLFSAISSKKHCIDASNVYLPLPSNTNKASTGLLCLIISDVDEQSSIHWSLLHSLILRDYQTLQQSSNQSSETTTPQTSEHVKIQRLLNQLAEFASENRDEKLLLDKGAEIFLQFLDIDHVGITLIDDERKFANLISDVPHQESSIRKLPVEGPEWEQLARGEHVLIENIPAAQLGSDSQEIFDSYGIQSALLLPFLDLSGKHIGSIGLDKFNGNIKVNDEQIETARLVSAQLVSHLENLRLVASTQRFANQMQQIAKFGETVQSRLELQEILQTSLHFANRIIDVDYINIVLYDESIQKLIVRAYRQKENEVILPPGNPTMPIDKTVVGTVWRNRDAVYIRDYDSSKYENPYAKDVKVLYANALISRGVTRGVIEIGRTTSRAISNLDQSVASQLSNQLAVAIENTLTYTQSQRLAQNKILANEISLQLQQQMDMDSLLNTTITELGKALGAKRARIRLGVKQAVDES